MSQKDCQTGCQKKTSETNAFVTTVIKRSTYLVTLVSVHRIALSFFFLLFSDKNVIMTVMQKLEISRNLLYLLK